jgi:hypothetical protein
MRRRRKTCILLLVIGVLIFAGLINGTRSQPYRRYVSQPLPDGTRYTFLYPEWSRWPYQFTTANGIDIAGECPKYRPNIFEAFWDHLSDRYADAPSYPESIVVEVFGRVYGKQSSVKGEQTRTEAWSQHPATYFICHEVTIEDVDRYFVLHHSCPTGSRYFFDQSDKVVTQSFRVLAPGEKVPSP